MLCKSPLKTYSKQEKTQKSKRSPILILIPYPILYKAFIKNLSNIRKTFKIKETPNSYNNFLHYFQKDLVIILKTGKASKTSKRLRILIIIPYTILHKAFIQNLLNTRKTLKIKETSNSYNNSLHYFI